MSDYANRLAELATDPSTHALAAVLGWLVVRVEQLHRRTWRRLREFGRRLRAVEQRAQPESPVRLRANELG